MVSGFIRQIIQYKYIAYFVQVRKNKISPGAKKELTNKNSSSSEKRNPALCRPS
jgi:hypothetical protein